MVSQKIKSKIKLTSLLITALIIFAPSFASAATLSIGASKVKVAPGDTFSASISVNTQSKTINNAEASISFPTNLLEVTSISQGSVLSIWVETPTFSNSAGTISFNGGVPNPGFSGSGSLATVQFKAKAAGTANISFTSAFVRENDGYGTNILSSRSGASITIETAAPAPAPTPTPQPEQAPTPASPQTPKPTTPTTPVDGEPQTSVPPVDPSTSIVIRDFTSIINPGETVKIVGTIPAPDSSFQVFFRSPDGVVWSYEQKSILNDFNFESQPILKSGFYQVWLESKLADGTTVKSEELTFEVKMTFSEQVRFHWNNFVSTITIERVLILILILLAALGWYKYYRLQYTKPTPASTKAKTEKTRR